MRKTGGRIPKKNTAGTLHSIGATSVDDETIEVDVQDADTNVARAATLLGEPEAVFRASSGRVRAKFALALGLIVYGILANIGWFGFGPGKFGHFEVHLLFLPPIIGGALLWHLWRHRGLRVLIYPTGLLRLQHKNVDSFPWEDINAIRMKLQPHGEPFILREDDGTIRTAWLATSAPTFQVWNVWLDIARTDGTSGRFTGVLADFPDLAAEVQRRTFPTLWALTQAALDQGIAVEFADGLTATDEGLRHNKLFIRWDEMKYLKLSGKMLNAKKAGSWLAGISRDATTVLNLHVLFALAAEKGVTEKLEEGDDD
ncbi:hypothetical protein BH11PLA2_BH11PLA2_14110 [soil metagenome]